MEMLLFVGCLYWIYMNSNASPGLSNRHHSIAITIITLRGMRDGIYPVQPDRQGQQPATIKRQQARNSRRSLRLCNSSHVPNKATVNRHVPPVDSPPDQPKAPLTFRTP